VRTLLQLCALSSDSVVGGEGVAHTSLWRQFQAHQISESDKNKAVVLKQPDLGPPLDLGARYSCADAQSSQDVTPFNERRSPTHRCAHGVAR
jgi:hypothetical protein